MKIFDLPNIQFLKKSLDVYTKQHEAIARNVANANNPNYQRVNTDFSSVLQSVSDSKLRVTDERHFKGMETGGSPTLPKETGGAVDITKEMADLAVNQLKFDFASRVLRGVYNMLSASITGRTR